MDTPTRARVEDLQHPQKRKRGQHLKRKQRLKLQWQFIETFGGLGPALACERLGLSRYAFYAWLRSDADFKQRYEEKLASYQLDYSSSIDDEETYDRALAYHMSLSEGQIIWRMKMHERMKQRNGQPHNIWW